MSETVTLYTAEVIGVGINKKGNVVGVDRVGEFRQVSWCRTHDEPYSMRFGGSLHEVDDDCELVEVWQEVTP